ncbi:MAG: acetolactate synthase large subunit [Proteobacteria bacterium]|nr:acetolactate synthase large subunit [Pseudomonadota bacterium]
MSSSSSSKPELNGAESLVQTLIGNGLKVCFANPGTSEMHFVAALDRIPGLRCIPGMQENVVTGMADGYGRIARDPAVTLLHCGPGLANGLANLHNAKKARSPIVNIVGDQATYHAPFSPPLAMDTVKAAETVSHWVRTSSKAADVGRDGAEAVRAARTEPGQVATLILPSNASWDGGGTVAARLPVEGPAPIDTDTIRKAADILRTKSNVLILLGDNALRHEPQQQVARIQEKTNCRVMAESINGLHQRGAGRLPILRVPYPAPLAIDMLKDVEHFICAGSRKPTGFFAYPGVPSFHAPDNAGVTTISLPGQDAEEALRLLADELGAPAQAAIKGGPRPDMPKGIPNSEAFGQLLAAIMPEGAIIADESITFGGLFYQQSHTAPPHDWLMVTGGAIGYGPPCATGAAVAGAGRRVINPQADGSAMYTLQALWTQARERLPVTTVILSNRKYQILIGEYASVGANPGPTAMNMLDLGNPDLDWVKLANGMGVEAAKASTLEDCGALMQQSFRRDGPFLIELEI